MDELLRQQVAGIVPPLPELVVQDLRRLQQNLLDLVVLTCSRFMDQTILQAQGVPALLVSRLEAAFTPMPLHLDLWSRLGNSKYHIFTNGVRFSNRNKRHGRGGRGNRPHVEASAASSSGNLATPPGLATAEDSAADIIEETKLDNIKLVLHRRGVYTEALLDDLAKAMT